MMTSKDDLLAKIVALEASNKAAAESVKAEMVQARQLETQKTSVKKAFDMMKERLDTATRMLEDKQHALRDLNSTLRSNETELERARRELSRLADAEAINERYQAEVHAFRERCLTAPWRAENRSDGLGAKEYQVDGAIHMAVAKRGILGDRMGLGKSLTSLIWCDFNGSQKVVIICPSDTMNNYVREIHLWAPHRHPIILGGMARGQRDFLLNQMKAFPDYMLILNFEAWRQDETLLDAINELKPDTLIVDEAHNAKEWATDANQGMQKLTFGLNQCPGCTKPVLSVDSDDKNLVTCKHCGTKGFITDFCSVQNVLPMTGTPILNKPQELFPMLRMIDPKNFKTKNDFLKDFCYKDWNGRWTWQMGKEEELVNKIGPRFMARDRKMVGVEIPPAAHILHLISMAEMEEKYPRQHKAYLQVRDYAQLVMDQGGEEVMSMPIFLTVLMRLRQVAVWPNGIELKHRDELTGEHTHSTHLDVFESCKIDKAEQIIREAVDGGERVVLFSQFKDSLRELRRRFHSEDGGGTTRINAAIYAGETSHLDKRIIERDFDSKTSGANPRYDVVLANYRSGGAGLNFQAASQMVILDEEWNPGKQSQAYGRIDRLGQTRDTTIHTIRVENTVDVWMAELQEQKASLIGGFETQTNMAQEFYNALRNGDV
jgi:SNF2 family DNA or RNA helicase